MGFIMSHEYFILYTSVSKPAVRYLLLTVEFHLDVDQLSITYWIVRSQLLLLLKIQLL